MSWRARRIAERAEHAANTRRRSYALATASADVEELAGVERHVLLRPVVADWAGDDGLNLDRRHRPSVISSYARQSYPAAAQPAGPRLWVFSRVLLSAQSDGSITALVSAAWSSQVGVARVEAPYGGALGPQRRPACQRDRERHRTAARRLDGLSARRDRGRRRNPRPQCALVWGADWGERGPHGEVVTIRDGKITEMVVYRTVEDALTASEQHH